MVHARVFLLTARLHAHHAVVSIRHTVGTTHWRHHGGTLGGALTFRMAVRGLHTVGPIGTESLLARFCNRTDTVTECEQAKDAARHINNLNINKF